MTVAPSEGFWSGRRVVVTGHTGFKGSWLSLWLVAAGARVTGIALEPEDRPALFDQLALAGDMDSRIADIRDAERMRALMAEAAPEVVFHLAAQPLVLKSYRDPLETWSTNVMGTAHVLEAIRHLDAPCTVVVVTTDKVYANSEWEFGYRENDPLGGHDPYSASKAGTELAAQSWRKSFFAPDGKVRLATARAGNVIGGGDWSENRIVPDIMRALARNEDVVLRNPGSVRPWQHVLDPLWGYLLLAQTLHQDAAAIFQDAFNFGPDPEAAQTVQRLVETALSRWPGRWRALDPDAPRPHEAALLTLDTSRARSRLGWAPCWGFDRAVAETVDWYQVAAGANGDTIRRKTLEQIEQFKYEIHTT